MKTLSTAVLAGLLAVNASAFGPPCLPMPCPEKQVLCTIKVVTVREMACKELKLNDCERFCTPEMTTNLLQSLKGCSTAEFISTPRMMVLNGQKGFLSTSNLQKICTGVTVDCQPNGTILNVPKMRDVDVGLRMECLPTISVDGKQIVMNYNATRTWLDDSASLPVTSITPVFEGGSQGQPVPFTTFIQWPASNTETVAETVKLADGSSLWTCLGHRPCQSTVQTKIPILGDLPILGNLFCNSASTKDVEYTFVLMTVKIVTAADQVRNDCPLTRCPPTLAVQACPLQACPVQPCPAPLMLPSVFAAPVTPPQVYASSPQLVPAPTVVPASGCLQSCCPVTVVMQPTPCCPVATAIPPAKNDMVLKVLLEQYDVACKAGDTTKAKTLAAFCLEMDPACFAKK